MAMVSQNPVLFSGSVRYNIKYGLKGCSDEQVEEAAKRANADNFICKLADGYTTGHIGSTADSQTLYKYITIRHQIQTLECDLPRRV